MMRVESVGGGDGGSGCRDGGGRGRGGRGACGVAGGGVPPLARGGGSDGARRAGFPRGFSWGGPAPRDTTHAAAPLASAQPRGSPPPSRLAHAPPHAGPPADPSHVAAASESSCCACERAPPSVARGEEPRAAREEPAGPHATRPPRTRPPPASLLAQPGGPRAGLPRVRRAGRLVRQEGAGVCGLRAAGPRSWRKGKEGQGPAS